MTETAGPPLAPGACCDTSPCTCQRDPFWQQQIDEHVASRGRHADPSACGTCRALVTAGKPVEDDECAQRAMLIQPPDMPCWEILIEMTEQEKKDLPARFHLPVFESLGKPNAWLCAVCWGDGWSSCWPCATATKHGTQVFTPDHEAGAALAEARAKLEIAERRNRELAATLAERDEQIAGLLAAEPTLDDDQPGVPA
ncbi:hypothetical protein ACFWNE_07760 [Streptomyces goshikiensis]|uniref:hypothetical protein n=1 Tax=Streptomyces goshikiensis TaxID=1942 RepID=UPI00365DFB6A